MPVVPVCEIGVAPLIVVAFVHVLEQVPVPSALSAASSRTSELEANPDPLSVYCVSVVIEKLPLVFTLVLPAVLAAAPFTVTAPPLGAAVSLVKLIVLELVFPATSVLVIVLLAGFEGPAFHE